MSDKGGSDLDIFKDLAKRGNAPSPPATKAPTPQQTLLGLQAPSRQATTRGMPAPPPVPSRPPPPPSRGQSVPPPPLPTSSSALNSRPSPIANAAPPPPSAPLPKAPPAPSVEMDWDDEDEKTSIYDRGGTEDSARSLLAASAPPPPAAGSPARSLAPPPRVSVPAPPTRPTNRPPAPVPVPGVVPVPAPAPVLPHKQYRDSRSSLYVALLGALVVAAAAAAWLLWPRTGSLVVTVSGPGNKPLDAVEILLNGNKKCSSSPCTIDGLKADTYYVRAHAAGYQAMADIAVVVAANGKAVQNLTLVRALGTGVKVLGEGAGLKLFVDGREVGPLPQEIKDMEPGEHTIKVGGSERFEEFEKKVTIEPETMQTIGPLKLHVLKGLATIVAGNGAEGAKVILISGSDRRTLPKLPITLDIPTNQPHTLVATRRGYEQFKLPIRFEDGQVDRTFEVALAEVGSSTEKAPAEQRPSLAPTVPRESRPVAESPSPAPAAPAGQATLNINSIPVSNILVDGRPIGQTPRIGFKVSAGSHTVTFLHGDDRKSMPVNVSAGQTKTVAVRF